MINGLTYITHFISLDDQNSVVQQLDNLEWSSELKRRTKHFGYKYNYTQKKITKSSYIGIIPEFFNPLIEKIKI